MIEINNLVKTPIDKGFLKKIATKVLKGERKRKMDLSIALVGPARIKELNKKYRKKNKPTDTLSFLYDDFGEIVICPNEIKKNARKFKAAFKKELTGVLIHGVLHLLGYEHENDKIKAAQMESKENQYLAKIS